ncbi:phospholipid/cholesterol/gamma-HCH transport system substrate-binding protein [Tahibacter aquaticus]|uniref:Phospholipid/cholesterol/gamma-HCH transport system substrate-binding protein n=1 Tax=Tahibacter aquaticus TaxID=520092 RepID=A0A4R6Z4B6_9GAMM|nr:MlaD family protein [Tahibacter aquaticus]TDR46525.1 phospholipid/cholesterol/gamma-HCH transport system substrate-binding protein [Tahibacter aquaticus]
MKRDHVNYTLVGSVVLAALALLLLALFLITGRRGGEAEYHTYYRNVSGLRAGAPVFYQGYRIGQVGEVLPERGSEGTRYRIELNLRADWPIPADSVARMQSSGLLADVTVAIREGTAKDALAVGGEIKGEEGTDLFGAMNELAGEITTLTRSQITPLIRNLSQRVDSITGSLDQGTPKIINQAQDLLVRLTQASEAVNDLLKPSNRAAVSDILGEVQALSRDLDVTKRNLDAAVGDLAGMTKDNRPGVEAAVTDLRAVLAALSSRIDAITHHMDSASRNLDEFSREIRKNPNRLLLSPKADKVEESER